MLLKSLLTSLAPLSHHGKTLGDATSLSQQPLHRPRSLVEKIARVGHAARPKMAEEGLVVVKDLDHLVRDLCALSPRDPVQHEREEFGSAGLLHEKACI